MTCHLPLSPRWNVWGTVKAARECCLHLYQMYWAPSGRVEDGAREGASGLHSPRPHCTAQLAYIHTSVTLQTGQIHAVASSSVISEQLFIEQLQLNEQDSDIQCVTLWLWGRRWSLRSWTQRQRRVFRPVVPPRAQILQFWLKSSPHLPVTPLQTWTTLRKRWIKAATIQWYVMFSGCCLEKWGFIRLTEQFVSITVITEAMTTVTVVDLTIGLFGICCQGDE